MKIRRRRARKRRRVSQKKKATMTINLAILLIPDHPTCNSSSTLITIQNGRIGEY